MISSSTRIQNQQPQAGLSGSATTCLFVGATVYQPMAVSSKTANYSNMSAKPVTARYAMTPTTAAMKFRQPATMSTGQRPSTKLHASMNESGSAVNGFLSKANEAFNNVANELAASFGGSEANQYQFELAGTGMKY